MTDRICSVDDCQGTPRQNGDMCPKHIALAGRPIRGRFVPSDGGYIRLCDSAHPLSTSGFLFEHRAVLYDAIGPGSHACHWCGRAISWTATDTEPQIQVDHLDGNKQDNATQNLVPSCGPCNNSRRRHYKLDRTHCVNGHEYTPDNLDPKYPYRRCITCCKLRLARRRSAAGVNKG